MLVKRVWDARQRVNPLSGTAARPMRRALLTNLAATVQHRRCSDRLFDYPNWSAPSASR
jgi:hypothetical protein